MCYYHYSKLIILHQHRSFRNISATALRLLCTRYNMHYSSLIAFVYLIRAVWSAAGYTQQNGGRTRLTGSSFGVLGINATFDYVVCLRLLHGNLLFLAV